MSEETNREEEYNGQPGAPNGQPEEQSAQQSENAGQQGQQDTGHYSNQPQIGGHGPSQIRQHFSRGITYFLVIAAALIFYFILLRVSDIYGAFMDVLSALRAVIYGCIIAYLLNPLVRIIEGVIKPRLEGRIKKAKTLKTVSRGTSVAIAMILVVLVIVGLINMVVPEVISNIRRMATTLPGQINNFLQWLNSFFEANSTVSETIMSWINSGSETLSNYIRTELLPNANAIMANLTRGVVGIAREIINVIIGVIVSVYLLMGKETFSNQSKKLVYAAFNSRHANLILHLASKSNEIFSGFITGKILDSAIIACICFVVLTILNMPYTVLISLFVGVCNIIPVFGPIIGAIPSTFLIVLSDPIKGLYFIIFIFILQQFDGNILGPRILGNSTGLPGFWVIVAIMLGGGLFGFPGMVLGCPTFAVIYYIVKMLLQYRLEQKDLPASSAAYGPESYVDSSGQYVRSEDEAKPKDSEDKDKEE